jgi:hypothetical protein
VDKYHAEGRTSILGRSDTTLLRFGGWILRIQVTRVRNSFVPPSVYPNLLLNTLWGKCRKWLIINGIRAREEEFGFQSNWLPGGNTHRTNVLRSIWEKVPYYTRLYERRQFFVRGIKPKKLADDSKITQHRWQKYKRQTSQENPIAKGMRYLRVFESESVNTYAQAAEILEVSRQRVYQHVALATKLAPEIIEFVMRNRDNLDVTAYFTERRLRPLTMIADKEEQIAAFREMLSDFDGSLPEENTLRQDPDLDQ